MGIWTFTVLAYSTFIMIDGIFSVHFLQRNEPLEVEDYSNSRERKLKKPVFRRETPTNHNFSEAMDSSERTEDIPDHCVHEDWPLSASVNQAEGDWEVRMLSDEGIASGGHVCNYLSLRKLNDSLLQIRTMNPEDDSILLTASCFFHESRWYKCQHTNQDSVTITIFLRLFPRSSRNSYMIVAECGNLTPPSMTSVISRRNHTLSSDDLENVENLRQELGMNELYSVKLCTN